MFQFRSGHLAQGRLYYAEAYALAQHHAQSSWAVSVLLYHARESGLARDPLAAQDLAVAQKSLKTHSTPELELQHSHVLRVLTRAGVLPAGL